MKNQDVGGFPLQLCDDLAKNPKRIHPLAPRAVELYEKAGGLEYAPALQTLAMAYQNGELGLERNEVEARRYFFEDEHAINHPLPQP